MRSSVRYRIGAACAILLIVLCYNLNRVSRTWKHIPWTHHDRSGPTTKGPDAQDDADNATTPHYTSFTAELSSTSTMEVGQPTQTLGSKIIVMAKLEKEDTSWVGDELPE